MLKRHEYPILEFDDSKTALINPDTFAIHQPPCPYNKLVITFFKDAITKLIDNSEIEEYRTICGENDLILYKFKDSDTLLMHGMIGCPATAGFLDELTGLGINKVMFCGGGGVLDKSIDVGKIMLVEGAIRDEGFSYHYVEPSRVIYTDERVKSAIRSYLDNHNIPYFEGLCWTTDAFYRETRDMIAYRRSEGAKIVEMEQSGCIAVAQFRGISYGALIYAGDDVSGAVWDSRSWRDKGGVRYTLIKLCRELLEIV